KKLILIAILLFSSNLVAQKSNVFLRGMVRDSLNLIKDVHVVNLNTLKGTYSNDYGQFRISVSLGDTLEFTSVQFETVKKLITDGIFFSKKLNLILKNKNYVLNEITVKKHSLIGDLRTDRKKVPLDTIALKGKKMSNIIDNISKESQKGMLNTRSVKHSKLAEKSMRNADPTRSFNGANLMGIVNGIINLIPKKKKNRLSKKEINEALKNKLLTDFGNDFFEELKIPRSQIIPFLEYCKQFNIEDLYRENKRLDIIKLLEDKSHIYLVELKQN
ncbi:MAG: hypothetical protein ACPG4G_07345, partial [Flavobacteriaceae bacterium]